MSTRLVVFILALLVGGCGQTERLSIAREVAINRPVALLVTQEISGKILGEEMRQPAGVAVDLHGRIYVTDAGNNRVLLFDERWSPLRDIGGFGSEPGQFDRPSYITIDNNLNLLISDAGNRRIARYDSKLNFVSEIRLEDDDDPLKFGEPSGLALTDYGELWISDRDNHQLMLFNNIERFDRFVGDFGYAGGQLASPEKIVRYPAGDFIVCDAGNSRLVIYDLFGNHRRTITLDEFDYPLAAVIERSGSFWVLDGITGRLFYLSPKGELLFSTGPLIPGTVEPLLSPSDLAIVRDSSLVIVDSGNNRLLIVSIIRES